MCSVYAAAPNTAVSPAPKARQRLDKTTDKRQDTCKKTNPPRPESCGGFAVAQPVHGHPTGLTRGGPVFHANPIGPGYALLPQISRQTAVGCPELSAEMFGQRHASCIVGNPPSKALSPAQRGRSQPWCLRNLDDIRTPRRLSRRTASFQLQVSSFQPTPPRALPGTRVDSTPRI
jgi:hypothetical protein